MSNVQLENGYTRIANEILEIICLAKLNATQLKILLCIIRYTYGFGRKEHEISLSFISKATNVSKRHISSELNKLIEMNIVLVTKEHTDIQSRKLKLNKKYETWVRCGTILQQVSNTTTDEEVQDTPVEEFFHTPVEESFHQEIKYLNKYKEKDIFILNYWNDKGIVKHSLTDAMVKHIKAALKKHSKEEIIKAIDNYKVVYSDKNYYYNHIWRLDKFLKQANGLPNFLEDGQVWLNYNQSIGNIETEEINPIYNVNGR
ncbi:replication protein [Alkaliphilus pronyensis]|uniref:Replication protein n=1 Tax=Alkaliphilus pronyensis TaxID=1482732 RepID=A0A6I0F9M0_9FIRM|nr:replication protein [Alkaliphilus pronyensis]KAB3533845.1 replication protein [Alkaliphilus pronyensis]